MSDERAERRKLWGEVASAWAQNADPIQEMTMPLSARMIDLVAPQPGQRILELAAGAGDVGFLAAELIKPGGELICSDFAPEMLTAAQERAKARGVENVRFRQIDAESIDLEAGSVDGVLCRWGYMLMTDPPSAMRETRRVLRQGGRLAWATWAPPEENPALSVLPKALTERGALDPVDPDAPGPFRFSDPQRLESLMLDAGFVEDVAVESVAFDFVYPDFDTWWSTTTAMSARSREGLEKIGEAGREEVRAMLREALAHHATPDGGLRFTARTWVGSATA